MTHPAATRQEALARLMAGESQREVAAALGISAGTIATWAKDLPAAILTQKPSMRERLGNDFMIAAVRCCERTVALLPNQESVRDTAYAAKVMVEAGMELLDWRQRAMVNIDASQHLTLPPGLTLDELRALAGPAAH